MDHGMPMLVLLYESAETWLTVYCRLDIAKRARVESRTQMHVTMSMLFEVVITNE